MTVREARQYMEEGHFPKGSMLPKVEAAIQFVSGSGNRAVITSVDAIEKAVLDQAGTRITMDRSGEHNP